MATFVLDSGGKLWSDPQAIVVRPKPRSRRWAPKKRTGCLTCRERRVKCDEGKPSCRRCLVASRECTGSGYSVPSPSKESSPSRQLVAAPRRPSLLLEPEVVVSPAGIKTSRREMMQFHFFRQEAATSMAGVFDRKFCSRDMLQATSFHPIVWHASCALAAMYQREALATVSKGEVVDTTVMERHSLRNFALEQYNESIGGVLNIMKSAELSNIDLEVLLTTTLMFTAIASLQGDFPAAVVHVINGQRLWQRWQGKIENKSAGKKKYLSGGLLTPSSVGAVMGRLVAQSSVVRPAPWSADYYKSLETPIISQDPFASPEDAYYEFEPLSKSYYELRERNKFISDPAQRGPPVPVRRAYAAALAAWSSKFDAMRTRDGAMDAPNDAEAILVLQARQVELVIQIDRDPTSDEMTWDAYFPRFDHLVALGEELQARVRRTAGRVFSFSSSMMDGFFWVAVFCRDHGIRHRALALLRALDAREGMCNSRLGYAIAAPLIEIEEAPGEAKLQAALEGRALSAEEEMCACEARVFVCGEHRVTTVAGEYRPDDVGTLKYFTKQALDYGLPPEVREIAW